MSDKDIQKIADTKRIISLCPGSWSNLQKRFTAFYLTVSKYSALDAARRAGYKYPESSARDNMVEGHYVKEWISEYLRDSLPDDEELVHELLTIALTPIGDKVSASDKRQAIKDILELRGRFVKRIEISNPDEIDAILGRSVNALDDG